MIKAYTRTLKNYVAFSGRTKRSEYWLFVLAQSLILAIGLVLAGIHDAAGLLLTLYLLGTLIPTLAATVRRLHDTSRGFWWLSLGVVPAPVAYVLGSVGVLLIGVAFLGWVFDLWAVADNPVEFGVLAIFLFLLFPLVAIALLLLLVIVVGVLAIILLVFLASPSTRGENKYGPHPE